MLRIGIAGFGKIGKIRAQEIQKNSRVKLVAIYDVIEQQYDDRSVVFCNSYEALLDQSLDAVFICTYNNVLADYSIQALKKGIHVFCEKPPARTLKELRGVEKIHNDNKHLVLKYGFNHRYHYSVLKAKEIIDSGELGKIMWMRGVYGKAGSIDFNKNWRNYKKYSGGGILIDQGIHMLDLILFFTQEKFSNISSFITNSFWKIEAEDNAFVLMKSENDTVAMVHSSATHWKHKFLLEIYFEKGFINLDGILSKTNSYAPEKLIMGRKDSEDINLAMGKPNENSYYFENDNSWELEVNEFIDAIMTNKKILNGTISDAMNVLELVENVYNNSK
jgi:predicted dehydrogenase